MFIKTRSLFTGTSYRSECIQRASLSRVTCHESVRAPVTAASVTTSARPQLSLVSPAPLHPSFFRHVQYSTWMLYVPDRWMQYLGSKYFSNISFYKIFQIFYVNESWKQNIISHCIISNLHLPFYSILGWSHPVNITSPDTAAPLLSTLVTSLNIQDIHFTNAKSRCTSRIKNVFT